MDTILRDLHAQTQAKKTEEGIDFSITYLKHLESCYHVVGTNYLYILESVHNRKSFIFCLSNALKGFPEDTELTSNELFLVIETLCPDFPRNLLTEAVLTAAEQYNSSTLSSDYKFPMRTLSRSIMCHILYDEWLKALEESFRSEGRGFSMPLSKINSRCEQCQRNLPPSCPQPLWAAVQGVFDETGRNSTEMSFERFKRAVFGSEATQCELKLLTNYPAML